MTNKTDIRPLRCYNEGGIVEETRGESSAERSAMSEDTTNIHDKRIWVIEDVMTFTGFSKSTVYKMTARREIPHRKRGKKLFFLPDEIWNWIEEG